MIGVVIPLWVHRNPALVEMTERAVSRLKSHEAVHVFIACTRLHTILPGGLHTRIAQALPNPEQDRSTVLHEPGVGRCVAAAWNWGVSAALNAGCRLVCVTANDVLFEPDTLNLLAAFGRDNPGVDVWSGLDLATRQPGPAGTVTEGCDYAGFMLRPATIARHGWFDENFRPAYWEDLDHHVRVVQGGGYARVFHDARFWHLGSQTIKLEPDAQHHVRHWGSANAERFRRKWGVATIPPSEAEIRQQCYARPFNDAGRAVSWWESPPG